MIAPQTEDSAAPVLRTLKEARTRTLALVADLTDEQMMGPRLAIVNPLRWEIAHLAWFQEYWLLRHLRGCPPLLPHGDSLYDSARVAHDTRWDIPLLSRVETLDYMQRVLDRVFEEHRRQGPAAPPQVRGNDELYFLYLALFHETMHAEAFTYTRQTLGYAPPRFTSSHPAEESPRHALSDTAAKKESARASKEPLGDAKIPGGTFFLGSAPGLSFVFDNEQWAHPVAVEPFSIARTAVANAEFAAFVSEGGYRRREFWTQEGWHWRERAAAEHPVYWRPVDGRRWLRRNFDVWLPLEENLPVVHVNWHEAAAYCQWAGRRLPTEAEWEVAASAEPWPDVRRLAGHKRIYPWGGEPPTPERANLDWCVMGCVGVGDLPAGDSAFGCRQMIGNVWEWTATDFGPYPGFAPGPYKEYSAPWFGDHKALRGGCWATRSSLIRNTYRNFYKPDRRDVWAGFRTCAL